MNIKHTLLTAIILSTFTQVCHAEAPFGHLRDIEDTRNRYLINDLAKNETISYCTYIAPKDRQFINEAELDQQIRDSFTAFTKGIAEQIKNAQRAEEFKDIIQILDKPVNLEKQEACNFTTLFSYGDEYFTDYKKLPEDIRGRTPSISFLVHRDLCTFVVGTNSSFQSDVPIPFICINRFDVNTSRYAPAAQEAAKPLYIPGSKPLYYKEKRRNSMLSIMHEIGHALTLADQYQSALDNNDVLYSTIEPGKGLMVCEDTITCDEVDGIITALDRSTGTKRTFKSLCNNGNIFENGRPVLLEEKTKTITRKENDWHSGTTTFTLDQHTKNTSVYRKFDKDTYTVNTKSIQVLRNELGRELPKLNLDGINSFTIENSTTLLNNAPVGKGLIIIKAGYQTIIKKVQYTGGAAMTEEIKFYNDDPKKQDLKSALDNNGKLVLRYSLE